MDGHVNPLSSHVQTLQLTFLLVSFFAGNVCKIHLITFVLAHIITHLYAWSDHGGWDAEILHPFAQPSAVRLLPIRRPLGHGRVNARLARSAPCQHGLLARCWVTQWGYLGIFGMRVSECRSTVIRCNQIQSGVTAGVDRDDESDYCNFSPQLRLDALTH